MAQELVKIATIRTGYSEKFGIPRQSGLVPSATGEIYFEPGYRSADAVKGLEDFSHIWVIWGFSEAKSDRFSATVTPPRLGGKERKGVFATRSPFRPNSLGLSSLKLKEIRYDGKNGPIIVVEGVDMLDGTPVYDIKPYVPYADAHPEASGSFADAHSRDEIEVIFPEILMKKLPEDIREAVLDTLRQDPRAAYNKKPDYVYGMNYAGYDIRFQVVDNVLSVIEIINSVSEDWGKVK